MPVTYASGRVSLDLPSNAAVQWLPAISSLYDRIVDPERTIRRVNITCCNIAHEEFRQLDLFSDPADSAKKQRMQAAVLEIQTRFGKDLMIRGMDLEDGAMTLERNHQIGGHRSGL